MGEEGKGGRREEGLEGENSAFAPALPFCQLQELGQVSTGHALARPVSAERAVMKTLPLDPQSLRHQLPSSKKPVAPRNNL